MEVTTRQFFQTLYPDLNGHYLEVRRLPGPVQNFCTSIDDAISVATADRGRNVYFGPVLRSDQKGDEDHAALILVLWTDLDWKDFGGGREEAAKVIAAFELQPSIIIETGNGWHIYWILKEPEPVTRCNRLHLRGVLLGLAEALGGDPSCRDLSRILRVPGTLNLKDPQNPKPVRVIRFHPERQYNLSDFEPWYVEDRPEPGGAVGVPSDDEIVRRMAGGIREHDGRDRAAFTVARRLAAKGLTEAETLALLHAWDQTNIPPLMQTDGSGILQEKVASAYKRQAEKGRTDATDNDAASIEGEQQQHRYHRMGAGALRKSYVPTRWLIEWLVAVGAVVLVVGGPGIGKTWLMLAAALAVALGKRLLDRFACESVRVLLVLEEEDAGSVIERLNLLYAGMGLSREEGDALPVEFLIQQGVCLSDDVGLMALEEQIREYQPGLVIIDPLRRVHTAEENDSAEMSKLFSTFRQLTQIPDDLCSILIVHHMRKRGEHDEGLDRVRGSSDIGASVDGVLEVSGDFGMLRVRHAKSKRGPTQGTFMVRADVSEESVRLAYLDPEEKTEQDTAKVRDFVVGVLQEGPINKKGLRDKGKARGYGRGRIDTVISELQEQEEIEVRKEGREHLIHPRNNDDDAAPPL